MPHPEIRSTEVAVDARILLWLATYPLQRAEDLVLGLARWCARPTVYRHLSTLEAAGLIVTIPIASRSGARVYVLGPAGLRWWNTQQEAAQNVTAWDHRATLRRFLPRLPVFQTLQAFLHRALLHLSTGLAHQGRHPRLVRWNWHRDYQHAFSFRDQGFTLRTDAAWTFGVQGWQGEIADAPTWFACFLLFQPLTEARLMTARLDRLLRWREAAERWAHYQAMPPLLILATSQRQAEWWQFCAEKAAARLHVDPPGGAIHCLEEQSQSDSPWQESWRRLVTHEHLHLRDLFAPLPLEALPQNLRPALPDPLSAHALSGFTLIRSTTVHASPERATSRQTIWEAHAFAEIRGERSQLAWLSCHLSARQWHLLTLLFAHPLLSREELAVFLGLKVSSTRLLLRPVAQWGIIVAHLTETGLRWSLTERGVRLLAAAHQVHVRTLATPASGTVSAADAAPPLVQRGLPWLLQHVHHTAGLYGFFARLAETADADHCLCWWETGTACERRYQRQDHWHNFRPDALAEYRPGTQTFRFWLEWDRGTMNERDLRAKFASYAYYLASREWVKERTPLPLLLCVTPDIGHERRLTQVARLFVAQTNGLTLYTTTARLCETQGLHEAIWRQVVSQPTRPVESQGRTALFANLPP